MSTPTATTTPASATITRASGRELILTRVIDAPRAKVFNAWADPALLKQWFAPLPYTISAAKIDLRPGGTSAIVMRAPDGMEMPCPGVFLDMVPNERIVLTDAYTSAWAPSEKAFMTVVVTFEDAGAGKTLYTARVLHWSVADREAHEQMGFHTGWAQVAEQLAALVTQR